MNLLRLDSGIRLDGSVTRAVADSAERGWLSRVPAAKVTRRDLGRDPLPARTWIDALAASTDSTALAPAERAAAELASLLVGEMVGADALLLAIPIYNFGVPHHVKAWVDVVNTDPRLRSGGGALTGKPALLVLARGGGYGEGTPRHGWDHNTPFLRRIFSDVWGLELQLIEVELTLADVNPAMEALRGRAAEVLAEGHARAFGHGQMLADKLRQLEVA